MRLFHSAPHQCGYWPQRMARDLVLDPHDPDLPVAYAEALALGFRRSGAHIYRPHCVGCRACVPVRVTVAAFVPNRSQQRCLRANVDLQIVTGRAHHGDEHLDLYQRYLRTRHRGGGMDDGDAQDFERFLIGPWSPSHFLEFRLQGRLLAVAVTDVLLPSALSAVYTFFDPEYASRGLGTLAILKQIQWAQREQIPHVYLGFWIDGHPKMDYKRNFRPLERLDGRDWQTL